MTLRPPRQAAVALRLPRREREREKIGSRAENAPPPPVTENTGGWSKKRRKSYAMHVKYIRKIPVLNSWKKLQTRVIKQLGYLRKKKSLAHRVVHF